MKKNLIISAAITVISSLSLQMLQAQSTSPYRSLAGNSYATSASKLGTTNSNYLSLFTNNSERIRIATNGRVGINTLSAAPTARLHKASPTGEDALVVNINGQQN